MISDIELPSSENRFTSYPHTEYFNSSKSLSINSLLELKISLVTIVKSLIFESKTWLIPEETTDTVVSVEEYPIPDFITLTESNLLSFITGLNTAPDPDLEESETIISGTE